VEDAVLDVLVAGDAEVTVVEGGRLRRTGFVPELSADQESRLASLEEILAGADLATPKESELPGLIGANPQEAGKLVDLLVEDGTVFRIGSGVVLHRDAVARAKQAVADWIRENGPLGPGDLKEQLGMTRKYSIPFLEWLDATRFTVRQGDRRILA
jgi:selenocysteine-specific elongation factor